MASSRCIEMSAERKTTLPYDIYQIQFDEPTLHRDTVCCDILPRFSYPGPGGWRRPKLDIFSKTWKPICETLSHGLTTPNTLARYITFSAGTVVVRVVDNVIDNVRTCSGILATPGLYKFKPLNFLTSVSTISRRFLPPAPAATLLINEALALMLMDTFEYALRAPARGKHYPLSALSLRKYLDDVDTIACFYLRHGRTCNLAGIRFPLPCKFSGHSDLQYFLTQQPRAFPLTAT